LLQGFHSPGKLLEFYVRPWIFGMISQFTLFLTMYRLYRVQVNSCYRGMNGERQWWMSRIYIFWLRTMTESTQKILKLDWGSPGFFSKEWKPCVITVWYLRHAPIAEFSHWDATVLINNSEVTQSHWYIRDACVFSDLTPLAGPQKGHLACKMCLQVP